MPSLAPNQTLPGGMTNEKLSSAWAYIKGQCTAFVASMANWIPPGLGNAAQWLHNAQLKGLTTSSTPTVGSVVVYGPGNGYDPANGHVAIVDQVFPNGTFADSEQNFDERGSVSHGRISSMKGVLGFILPPAGATTQTAEGPVSGGTDNGPFGITGAVRDFATALKNDLARAGWVLAGLFLMLLGLGLLIVPEIVKRSPAAAPLRVLKGGLEEAPAA